MHSTSPPPPPVLSTTSTIAPASASTSTFPPPSPPHPLPTSTSTPTSPPTPTPLSTSTSTSTKPKPKLDRTIQNVVLGNIQFPTWYSSLYPEELVGRSKVERLYVCQWCFKYSREVMPFVAHLKLCPSRYAFPPGRLIYKRDTHAIYEVDGEEYQLFTQNLSLFAKLFLDNKSVFYDVSSFKYYLLLLTPSSPHQPHPSSAPHHHPHPQPQQPQQIIGFFSKEKLSWDNNNLACILIFPPWQRRGFGKVLMGVSYELSRREGRIGGPEKPLSELGRKGYTRFWEVAVARFVLGFGLGVGGLRGISPSASTEKEREGEGMMMTVGEIARRCWVLPEDVIVALGSMGLLHHNNNDDDDDGGGGSTRYERKVVGGGGGGGGGSRVVVVINRSKVREWVRVNGVDLEAPVLEEGFVEEEEEGEGNEEGEEDEGGREG